VNFLYHNSGNLIRRCFLNFVLLYEIQAGRCHPGKDDRKETNHDVKSIEYFLKEKFDDLNIGEFKEFIHFRSDLPGYQ